MFFSAFVTPIAIWSHYENPHLTLSQKRGLAAYEIGGAAVTTLATIAITNIWNPAGWVLVASGIAVGGAFLFDGMCMESSFERKNGW